MYEKTTPQRTSFGKKQAVMKAKGNIKDAIKLMEQQAVKEVKGVIEEEESGAAAEKDGSGESEKLKGERVKENNHTTEEEKGIKRLPHQQVPQPGDFSTEALEKL